MGKNVIIAEGGRGRRFSNVSRLLTDKHTGNDAWVPVDERRTSQKYISKNGGYAATDDGVYGYSKLTVNIPGGAQGYTVPTVVTLPYNVEVIDTSVEPSLLPSVPGSVGSSVVGMDPDTGRMSVMTVNTDGTLSKELAPIAIRVLIPPAKTKYKNGDMIQFAGLVVELCKYIRDTTYQDELFPQGTISWSPVKNLLHPEYDLITPTKTAGWNVNFIATNSVYVDYRAYWSTYDLDGTRHDSEIYGRMEAAVDSPQCLAFVYTGYTGANMQSYADSDRYIRILFASKEMFNTFFNGEWTPARSAGIGERHGYYQVVGINSKATERPEAIHYGANFDTITSNAPVNRLNEAEDAFEKARAEGYPWSQLYNDWYNFEPSLAAFDVLYNDGHLDYLTEPPYNRHSLTVPVRWKSPYDGKTYEDRFWIECSPSKGM